MDGVPARVARRVASLGAIHSGVDIVEVAAARRAPITLRGTRLLRPRRRQSDSTGSAARSSGSSSRVTGRRWHAERLREEAYSLQRRLCDQDPGTRQARRFFGAHQSRGSPTVAPRPTSLAVRYGNARHRQHGFPDAVGRAAGRASPRRALRVTSAAPASSCLVRHGQSTWNLENLFTGWTDVDLTEQGRAEARAAGRLLRDQGTRVRPRIHFRAEARHPHAVDDAGRDGPDVDAGRTRLAPERTTLRCVAGPRQGGSTTEKFGAEQVKVWRRSYDIPPPPLAADDPRHPRFDSRYRGIPAGALPADRIAQGHARPRRCPAGGDASHRRSNPAATCWSSRTATACARWSRCWMV